MKGTTRNEIVRLCRYGIVKEHLRANRLGSLQ